jgi:ammonia channel protein AmtB
VRERNSLNAILMNYVALGFITVHWIIIGYTFSFSPGNEGYPERKTLTVCFTFRDLFKQALLIHFPSP